MIEKYKFRSKCLEVGNLNTKFIHRLIKWRRMKNDKGVKVGLQLIYEEIYGVW